jgi:hypothetical protein
MKRLRLRVCRIGGKYESEDACAKSHAVSSDASQGLAGVVENEK